MSRPAEKNQTETIRGDIPQLHARIRELEALLGIEVDEEEREWHQCIAVLRVERKWRQDLQASILSYLSGNATTEDLFAATEDGSKGEAACSATEGTDDA